MSKAILKKGRYYIGDPSYLFWKSRSEAIDTILSANRDEAFKVFGKFCFVSGTAHGDGVYPDTTGREYAVDTGMIGILPASLMNRDKVYKGSLIETNKLAHIITFKEDFECSAEDGIFTFGNIIINTSDSDEDEEEESNEDDFYNSWSDDDEDEEEEESEFD